MSWCKECSHFISIQLKMWKITIEEKNMLNQFIKMSVDDDNFDITYSLKCALEEEINKNYCNSAEYYKETYEEVKNKYYKLSCSDINYTKKFFKHKISRMKYNDIAADYDNKEYRNVIDKCKEFMDDKYMANDKKLDFRVILVKALYKEGESDFNNGNYSSSIDLLEESLKLINSYYDYYQIKNRCGCSDSVKNTLGKAYEKFGIQKWNNYNTSDMEAAIDLLRKAANLGFWVVRKNLELYYYLYKAYNESGSNITYYLEKAKEFAESGIYVENLYNKSRNISDLKNNIRQKEINISNLNYELNSINNKISNVQSMINAKETVISNKNNDFMALNQLANAIVSNTQTINAETKTVITNVKNQVEDAEINLKENESFVLQIKKLEEEKKEEIESMKNNNKNLKQKNDQLMLILINLESNLN